MWLLDKHTANLVASSNNENNTFLFPEQILFMTQELASRIASSLSQKTEDAH